ncbi:hypothetical protein I3843_06G049000 [Carya illinoinensis]|nr:hypothetical protein I3760_06G052700 [Carya illinoinensis]KAG7974422.1 hypothetical protein I3843_06G049000 [Carya illinoinensis]
MKESVFLFHFGTDRAAGLSCGFLDGRTQGEYSFMETHMREEFLFFAGFRRTGLKMKSRSFSGFFGFDARWPFRQKWRGVLWVERRAAPQLEEPRGVQTTVAQPSSIAYRLPLAI